MRTFLKELLKKILKKLNLYRSAVLYRRMWDDFHWREYLADLQFRLHGAADGYPFPPAKLIWLTSHSLYAEHYDRGGQEAGALILKILETSHVAFQPSHRILEWGCGCARVLRPIHAKIQAEYYGTDYNPLLVRWCRRSLPFARFTQNQMHPPLPCDDQFFDLVYAISVMTHLTAELQEEWVCEMHRISRPQGYFLFTTHGEPFISSRMFTEAQRKLFHEGVGIVLNPEIVGENFCGMYQSRKAVERLLQGRFEVKEFYQGDKLTYMHQDWYLTRRLG